MNSRRSSVTAKILAAVVALFSFVSLAPAAQAAPANIVMFGDSLLANPHFPIAAQMQGPGHTTGNAPSAGRCPRGISRVGASLQRQTGIKVDDFPCTGAAMFAPLSGEKRLVTQVNQALAQGKLTPATRSVFLQLGINDTYKAPNLYQVQHDEYVKEAKRQVNRIRRAAPNAKVHFLSYPEIAGRGGNSCWIHWNNAPSPVMPLAPLRDALDSVHAWQRAAARATGSQWVNLEAATRGHGSCAPREQRWIAGVIDNSSKPYNITTHLTHEGNDGVAAVIARHI